MYLQPNALQHLLPGEPSIEALHREEYFSEKDSPVEESVIVDPTIRERAKLLRAAVATSVGSFFA